MQDAGRDCVAVGHFNIADLVLLRGVFEAARELNVPVIVGASEGEREFAEHDSSGLLCGAFLNADHTHSLAKAEEAVKAGSGGKLATSAAAPRFMRRRPRPTAH